MGLWSSDSLNILLTQIIFFVLKNINKVMHKETFSPCALLSSLWHYLQHQSFAFCEIIPDQQQLKKKPAKGKISTVWEQM